MPYTTILFEKIGPLAHITLNRPQRLNAMNRAMLAELHTVCDIIEADVEVRSVVLSGAGKAFCTGFDLKEQAERTPVGVAEWQQVLRDDFEAVMRFWHLSKLTIAAVRGHALAGGFELMLACDMAIAADDARFGEPELQFGAGIVVMILPWLVGPKIAKEIVLAGIDDLPAQRAYELGLVNRVVAAGSECEAAIQLARRLAVIDPGLVRQTKRAINRSYAMMGMDAALEMALDVDIQIEGAGSPDKAQFLEVLRADGLKQALIWRAARFNGFEEKKTG